VQLRKARSDPALSFQLRTGPDDGCRNALKPGMFPYGRRELATLLFKLVLRVARIFPVKKKKMQQRVVSLGGNCMGTMEMRKFFGIQAANMFDWWITPGDALVRLIENDFDGLFLPENLTMVGDRKSVANLRYGILHHHDFPRNDEEDRVVAITDQDLQRNREKFAYLKKRWDDLGNNPGPVLFVRYGWIMGEPLLAGIPPTPLGADATTLMSALARKFPRLDYELLFIDSPEITLRHPKVYSRETRHFSQPRERLNASDLTWKDNTPIFSRLFSTVKLR
jgi:hypothetical protein